MSSKVCAETDYKVLNNSDSVCDVQPRLESRSHGVKLSKKLRRMVRQHTDQTTRTRNLKARTERIETGVLVKSLNGKNVSVERNVRDSIQWKASGQCSRRDA